MIHLILKDSNTENGEMPELERNIDGINTTLETVQVLRSSNITSIPYEAFRRCTSLRSIYMEDGAAITSIGFCAFWDCTSLQSIDIPNSVRSIGECAFHDSNARVRHITREKLSTLKK